MKYDYVVIGAGVSGLTSALILAKNGFSVALVEKDEHVAPVLRGFSRRGVHFDTGFHYSGGLGEGEPLNVFFRYLGMAGDLDTFPFRDDAFDLFRCVRREFQFRLPVGYDLLREGLTAAFPEDAPAIDRYLQLVRETYDSMPYLNLDADFAAITALQSVHGQTLKETLDGLTGNDLLKALLSMHCLLYGVAPDEVPFTQHARIVGSYYVSARGIRGGGLSLADAFASRLQALGVDLFCGNPVEQLTVAGNGELTGVRLKGGEALRCSGCVATLHPSVLLDLVPEGVLRPTYRKRLATLEETVSAYMLYGICNRPVPGLSGTNLFIFPDADRVYRLGAWPVEESPCYVTAAYRRGERKPGGFIGICPTSFDNTAQWMETVRGRRPESYRLFKQDVLERMGRQIALYCPELAEGMTCVDGSTPLTIRDFTGSPAGSIYGVKHKVGQYNPLPATRLRGLYLAGQGVVSPGILGAVLSGFMACGSILGHDRLRKELKACS